MSQNKEVCKCIVIICFICFIFAALVGGLGGDIRCHESHTQMGELPPQPTYVYELPPQFEGKDILPSWRKCKIGAWGHEDEVTKMRRIFTEKSISSGDPEVRKKCIDYAEKLTKWEQECRDIDRKRTFSSNEKVVNVRNRGDN